MTNEAAERLRGSLEGGQTIRGRRGEPYSPLQLFDEALVAERRATVERIRERSEAHLAIGKLSGYKRIPAWLDAILDAEAK